MDPILRRAVLAGLRPFNRGEFIHAHEAWEERWLTAQGQLKQVLHALILVAVGLHKLRRGEASGAARVLGKAVHALEELPDEAHGLDLAGLLASVRRLSAQGTSDPVSPTEYPVLVLEAAEDALDLCEPEAQFDGRCPYCGEPVSLTVDPLGTGAAQYVEDCPVCCRPWTVHLDREPGGPRVQLSRDDE